jgi:hypothetical protein
VSQAKRQRDAKRQKVDAFAWFRPAVLVAAASTMTAAEFRVWLFAERELAAHGSHFSGPQ